jgi:hypothetical protein
VREIVGKSGRLRSVLEYLPDAAGSTPEYRLDLSRLKCQTPFDLSHFATGEEGIGITEELLFAEVARPVSYTFEQIIVEPHQV